MAGPLRSAYSPDEARSEMVNTPMTQSTGCCSAMIGGLQMGKGGLSVKQQYMYSKALLLLRSTRLATKRNGMVHVYLSGKMMEGRKIIEIFVIFVIFCWSLLTE